MISLELSVNKLKWRIRGKGRLGQTASPIVSKHGERLGKIAPNFRTKR